MSFEYKVYVKIRTNVDISKLKYSLKIYNHNTQKIINQNGFSIDFNRKYNFIKSGSNYRTDFVNLVYNLKLAPIEVLRDLVIVFNIYRVDSNNKEYNVVKDYYVNNLVEEFEKSIYQNVKLDVVDYLEKNDPTKVVTPNNNNTVQLAITPKSIFICKEHPPNTTKDPFVKNTVEASLASRLKEPYPDQKYTNLCGPAAFFYCVLNSNKNIYKKIVKSLWEKGEASHNRLVIKPKIEGARLVSNFYDEKGNPNISSVDWITLASIRDSQNGVTEYNSATGAISAITTPDELKNWLSCIGFSIPVYHSFFRQKVPRSVDWLSVLRELSQYPSKDFYYVFLTNSALTAQGGDIPRIATIPSHYIVLNSALTTRNGIVNAQTDKNEIISATCFNWGQQDQLKPVTLQTLSRFLWAVIIVNRSLT
ncbi:hypothetical protein EXE10_18545 [Acinetobacter sp. WCHAc060033]|uniref:hypothetical protein n=1 Tax=Acinetobacter sp. WCHAc060033 TaxID=2518624 RepID=UPI0010231919|nr:hypothetical protein [Acinetobacter sp. WCHAc060033]RZG77976.1 hypothetical protein EXE10_18545 [Acinetobacter sp. WCHAc060033]